jgi:hypothetical protein
MSSNKLIETELGVGSAFAFVFSLAGLAGVDSKTLSITILII